jgi:Nucleoside-diphosphate-sugar epimerases
MRILVTGASGWIGSASVSELLSAGHEVLSLARSDAAAATITSLGAEPVAGSLEDLQGLRRITARVEGVVHLGYVHDFSRMEAAAQTDFAAIEIFAAGLAGTGGPLLIASGTLGLATGRPGTELDRPDPALHPVCATRPSRSISPPAVYAAWSCGSPRPCTGAVATMDSSRCYRASPVSAASPHILATV